MPEVPVPSCSVCGPTACRSGAGAETAPPFCPMLLEPELLDEVGRSVLGREPIRRLALESARTEAAGYCRWTRVEEIMDFARRLGAGRLGLAYCAGLRQEAKSAREIFEANGFEVRSVCCKVGAFEKERIGLTDAEKVRPGQFEALCNPVAQAALLHAAGTQLNVLVGLCVGHDSLFFMHSKAPVTVLVAKDRVLGHNPVAALYTAHSYYRRLQPGGDAR
ncbi:MAG TPA: DUF1847 domain-containing protein [Candidatus Sulfotelmatobacter sp.]|nr:DUF1847 domain-containing protein [Candidatus Sulfotelmatobacter sp.]